MVHGDREILGFCFTPQDGNSLASSINAALWLMEPDPTRSPSAWPCWIASSSARSSRSPVRSGRARDPADSARPARYTGVMAWVTCPHCGFTQIPSARCLRSATRASTARRAPGGGAGAGAGVSARGRASRRFLRAFPRRYRRDPRRPGRRGRASRVLLWSRANAVSIGASPPPPGRDAGALVVRSDRPLAGPSRRRRFPATPRGPALREVVHRDRPVGRDRRRGRRADRPGTRRRGRGLPSSSPTDPRRVARDRVGRRGSRRRGAALSLDFIPSPAWMPRRDRVWRALEGQKPPARGDDLPAARVDRADYLVQAGVNASGFLSYLVLLARLRAPPRRRRALDGHPSRARQLAAGLPRPRVGPLGRRRLRDARGPGEHLAAGRTPPTGSS